MPLIVWLHAHLSDVLPTTDLQIINVPLIVLGARPGGLDLKVLDVS